MFVYKVGEPHTHLEGYPKPLKEVLGIEGPVDAAFVCNDKHIAHIIKGMKAPDMSMSHNKTATTLWMQCVSFSNTTSCLVGQTIYDVDLKATPRVPVKEGPLTLFKKVDTAMCGKKGLTVVIGNYFYLFDSPMQMIASKAIPERHNVAQELFGCDH